MKKNLIDIMWIIVGSVIFAFSVAWISDPIGLVPGGVSGIGIILKAITNGVVPIFVTSFVLNLPLFVVCTIQRGFKFIAKSSIAFGAVTIALSVFESLPMPFGFEDDILVSSVLFGFISGIGLGMILRSGATSGGTDMLAAIIKFKKPSLPISKLIVIIDVIIIVVGTFVFGIRMSLYAVFAIIVSAKVIDVVLSGISTQKTVFVISEKSDLISKAIFEKLERGVTFIEATGAYTGKRRPMLMVVISTRELFILRQIVSDIDSSAFMTITETNQVFGEGFDEIFISADLG